MEGTEKTRYFLGANTASGFYSLYDEMEKAADFVWYIKGGPGNGKSTFMKAVAAAAEKAGHSVELVLCSGDPDSLDGVVIPELRTAYVDATSPHVREPVLPGAGGRYIDMTAFYRDDTVFDADGIADCFTRYRAQYARAYELLRSAALVSARGFPGVVSDAERTAAFSRGKAYAEERLCAGNGWRTTRRFASAYTCKGYFTCIQPGKEANVVDDTLGLADAWLRGAAEAAREMEQPTVLYPDPLTPEKLEGVMLPAAGLSFFKTAAGWERDIPTANRICPHDQICLRRLRVNYSDCKNAASLYRQLLALGMDSLKRAKEIHDELEEIYRDTVDFRALNAFTEKHIRKFFP